MPVVRSALGDDVYDAADCPAHFRAVIRINDAELQHRILRRSSSLNARSRRHVVCPIHGNEIEMNILAGERQFCDRLDDHIGAARRSVADLNRWRKQREVNEFPAVDRQIDNLPLSDDRAHLRPRGFLKLRSRLHLHLFRH